MKPRRFSGVLALVTLAATAFAQQPQNDAAHTILFVCEHGSARSVIAAAHFNRMAKEKGLPYRAVTRGANPDAEIPAGVRNELAADGLDVSTWRPQKVSDDDVQKADRVVTFACALPVKKQPAASKHSDWNDIPPVSQNYQAARKVIVDHVNELLKTLGAK